MERKMFCFQCEQTAACTGCTGKAGVLTIPMIAVIVKISNALSKKHPRIYKYSMIAFIGMLLAISLFCVVIKHQMSFLVIVACLAITLCDTIKNR